MHCTCMAAREHATEHDENAHSPSGRPLRGHGAEASCEWALPSGIRIAPASAARSHASRLLPQALTKHSGKRAAETLAATLLLAALRRLRAPLMHLMHELP
jgi:hypothetical protein